MLPSASAATLDVYKRQVQHYGGRFPRLAGPFFQRPVHVVLVGFQFRPAFARGTEVFPVGVKEMCIRDREEPEDKMSPAPTPKAVAAYPVPDGNPAGPPGLGLTVVADEE